MRASKTVAFCIVKLSETCIYSIHRPGMFAWRYTHEIHSMSMSLRLIMYVFLSFVAHASFASEVVAKEPNGTLTNALSAERVNKSKAKWGLEFGGHLALLSSVASGNLVQPAPGYALQLNLQPAKWRRPSGSSFGVFLRVEHNLWLRNEYQAGAVPGVMSISLGGSWLYFSERVSTEAALGSTTLLFATGLDGPGQTGLYLDVKPAILNWSIHPRWRLKWAPLGATILAPAIWGIPLIRVQYRTSLSAQWSF